MGVTGEQVLAEVADLRRWSSGGTRAPHKPLLLLVAIGRLQAGGERLLPFAQVEGAMRHLLERFGPPRRRARPEFPFWRLRNDGQLWEVEGEHLVETTASGDATLRTLRDDRVRAGVDPEVADLLRADRALLEQVVATLLERHFPASLHEEICEAAGLRMRLRVVDLARRDPRFRAEVLDAYEQRCAMCGYDGRLDDLPIALDAAHVRWWAHDGPDRVDNGLALCALHHRALDRGVVGVSEDHRITVSERFDGRGRARELIIDLAGAPLIAPRAGTPRPAVEHLRWHTREVFRGGRHRPAVTALAAEPPAGFQR